MIRPLAVFTLFAAAALQAQPNPNAAKTVRIDFSDPALIPATWTLTLHPDGSGHFRSQRGSAPRPTGEYFEAPDLDQDIHLNAAFAAGVFSIAEAKNFFAMQCESRDKVAFQGTKHLVYTGPGGHGECSFNYSRDRQIQHLSDELTSVAATIIEGARIERLRQHDRLGLDAEMETLEEMFKDGRAAEPEVIRPTLETLVNDDSLLDRVRRRARELLEKAGSN